MSSALTPLIAETVLLRAAGVFFKISYIPDTSNDRTAGNSVISEKIMLQYKQMHLCQLIQ